jgi:hypothetical protein
MNNFPPNGGGPPPPQNPFGNQPPVQQQPFGQPPVQQQDQLTHYKKLANTNYLGSWDMPAGGADLMLTIANVVKETVPNGKGKKEDCVVVHWVQVGWKPMILNATNRKNLHKAIGTPYIEYWRGKTVALYIDHNVRNPDGGAMIDGLRIRNKLPQ